MSAIAANPAYVIIMEVCEAEDIKKTCKSNDYKN